MKISDCPSLKCVSTIVDLAAMLKFLDITKCPNLTSLGDTLPTTLKFLRLANCPKLESIVDKLNKDTLLEELLFIVVGILGAYREAYTNYVTSKRSIYHGVIVLSL